MKLSKILIQHILMFLKYTFVISYRSNHYSADQYQPVEYVDFDLLSGERSDLSRSRYDLIGDFGSRSSRLPLLSRGIRDIEDGDDDFDDNVSIPSCSELRKMWRIARRIHHHAIKTNEIPQKLHPFSNFESDRFRTERRLNKEKSMKQESSSSSSLDTRSSSTPQKGSKEVASDANYGTIRYAPSDTVKRPGSKVYDVLRKLNPDVVYRSEKDPGAWNTGIIEFEPKSEKTRPFDKVRNMLRKDKNQPPLPDKSVSQSKNYWGVRKSHMVSHYKNKGSSNFDLVRKQIISGKPSLGGSRLNYRDDSSGAIQTGGVVPSTSFGRQLGRKKSFRSKNKKERKKMKDIQKVLSSNLRSQLSRESKKRKQRNRGKKKLRRKSSDYTRNFLLKGK